jgi:cytochrome c oxidase cbb3-type subunit III
MSAPWSWWIIGLVVLNVLGCVWLMWWTGRRRPGDPAPTQTSHHWDGDLTELNQPMPRWWLVLFYLTIVFAMAYLVWFPGLGDFAGTAGWTSANEHDAQRQADEARTELLLRPYAEQSLPALAAEPQALRYGQSVFANHCATCHGADARGAKGFPNLSDAIWHWGGSPEDILATVLGGRTGVMPPMGAAMGNEQGLKEIVAYVRSLSGLPHDRTTAAAGQARFVTCVACHGPEGKGNPQLGAPDLTDAYWLYGSDEENLRATISFGRTGQMPAHQPLIGATRARLAAAWVYARSRQSAASASDELP